MTNSLLSDDDKPVAFLSVSNRIRAKEFYAEKLGQDELGIWCSLSTSVRILWFEDPDGNILSLSDPVG